MHVPKQFLRAVEHDPRKCILWVGAGLSASGVRSDGTGLPDWHTLMQKMIDELHDAANCDETTLRALEQDLTQGEYLNIAQTYKERTRPDQFAGFLKSELDPSDIDISPVHRKILDIGFRGIITTNFDMVFERQSDVLTPLVFPQCLDDVAGFRSHGFFAKIHGCVRMTPNPAENLVLTDDSFELLRENPKYQTILKSCIVMHPLLTVGFSLVDPDFSGLIDDLRECLGDNMPTIYSLMRDPGAKTREQWLHRGIQIIPYDDHSETIGFFDELEKFTNNKKPPVPKSKISDIDILEFAEQFHAQHQLVDAIDLVDQQLAQFSEFYEKEDFLFRILAALPDSDTIRLAPCIVELDSQPLSFALKRVFRRAEQMNHLHQLRPSPQLLGDVNAWVVNNWHDITEAGETNTLRWLLKDEWQRAPGETLRKLLSSVCSNSCWKRLADIYSCSDRHEHIQEEIERVVTKPGFVPGQKSLEDPWIPCSEQVVQKEILKARYSRILRTNALGTPLQIIQDAQQKGFLELAISHLLDDFRSCSHMTIHSSSGRYNPNRAKEILDAFASIERDSQHLVFRYFNSRTTSREGYLGHQDDMKIFEQEFLQPLWWRFSSKTRIKYLEDHKRTFACESSFETGPALLLTDMMGLTFDPDREFRRTFVSNLTDYEKNGEYEPRHLQELWRDSKLSYEFCDDVPPELVRRIAVSRNDWSSSQNAEVRWEQARDRAKTVFEQGDLTKWFSPDKRNYSIDNLLGAYFASKFEVVLYKRMISLAARHLAIDEESLCTVVFVHESVHAYCHIGRDLDRNYWSTFAIPTADSIDGQPVVSHEAIAQFYTFKLIESLKDEKLMSAFLSLEKASSDVYRAWRKTDSLSLEQMRACWMKYRAIDSSWPPFSS